MNETSFTAEVDFRSLNKYDWKQSIVKAVKYLIIFIIPWLIDQFIIQYPQIAQLTVGALLVALANALKVKAGMKIP